MEIWRDIEGFEGIYQISSQGRVKSLKRIDNNNHPIKEKILKPNIDNREGKGYLRIRLCKNGKQKIFQIHRLVYETFVGKIPDDMQCNHINERKDDNRLENLNLMTPKENSNWGTRNERIGEAKKGMKLSEETKNKMKNHPNKSKIILQIELNGNIIADFHSLCEVQRQLGYEKASVSRCCLGKQKTAYGYKWQYKNG